MTERRYGLSPEDFDRLEYQQAQIENTGFRLGMYDPGYTIDGVLMRNTYELGETKMRIFDNVWGQEFIGEQPYDQLLIDLARTPLFRRLQSIEQLTLGPDVATMPNSMYFSRWEHIWGSVVFVRKMVEGRTDIDDRQKMVLQLRTLLSDVGHTAFSHLGDWLFQGLQGGEDMHDQDLKDIVQLTGIAELLDSYGFSVEETVFPDTEDWVECPAPDLCVDRVDYGLREILRWVVPTIPLNMYLRELHNPQSVFTIDDDGKLMVNSSRMARMLAAGFSLLPTEHWQHPVHRLQLRLFQSGIRSSVTDAIEFDNTHPREALYGIDYDFMTHLQTWPMWNLYETMKQIGLSQRKIFVQGRRADLDATYRGILDTDWEFPEFPDPLQPRSWQSQFIGDPYPANVDFEQTDTIQGDGNLTYSERGLVVELQSLKPRAIDPLIGEYALDSSQVLRRVNRRRLSEVEPSYGPYLDGQRNLMQRTYRATVLMRPQVAKLIVEEDERTEVKWSQYVRRQRNANKLTEIIRKSEYLAAAKCFDTIREVDDEDIQALHEEISNL